MSQKCHVGLIATKAVIQRCSGKKLFLKILQISEENSLFLDCETGVFLRPFQNF